MMSGKQTKWKKQITFLEEHPTYNLCFSWADIIDENGQNRNRENKELYQRFCSGNYPTKNGFGSFSKVIIFSVRQACVLGEKRFRRAAVIDMRWFNCRTMICGCGS